MKKRRILMGVLGENRSGRFSYAVNLFLALDPQKYEVTFLANTGSPFAKQEILAHGGKIISVTPRSRSVRQHRQDLIQAMREGDFDVCHIHLATASNIEPLLIAKKLGIKTVIAHSHSSQIEGGSLAAKLLHRYNRYRLGRLDILRIGCSGAAGEFMFPGEFITLYNGIDTGRFDFSLEKRETTRRELGLDGCFVFGHAGRMMPVKNHLFLLELLKEALELSPQSRLLLLGDGPLREQLEQKASEMGLQDRVLFLGDVPDPEAYYCAMDALLLPSFFEGFPLTVMEGVCSGLSAFVSDRVTKEVQIGDRVSFFPLDGDKKALAREILQTQGCPRTSGRKLLEQAGFDQIQHIRRIEELYRGQEELYGGK